MSYLAPQVPGKAACSHPASQTVRPSRRPAAFRHTRSHGSADHVRQEHPEGIARRQTADVGQGELSPRRSLTIVRPFPLYPEVGEHAPYARRDSPRGETFLRGRVCSPNVCAGI